MEGNRNIAYAALDVGTSQLKLGVYCPGLSPAMTVLGHLPGELVYGSGGSVRCAYPLVRERAFTLLQSLGAFVQEHRVEALYLGLCGHVSSLLEWNRTTGTPPAEPFPIWLDTTCHDRLEEYHTVMGEGRSRGHLGTFLPQGTNWLFTKLLHRRQSGFAPGSVFLQVADALFYELSGLYHTHFSSPISMVHIPQRTYAPGLLAHLELPPEALPAISAAPVPVQAEARARFGFPGATWVFPAMADLYASLHGLRLESGEGFMLANTSEQAGAFYGTLPPPTDRFLSIPFGPGFIRYGSTNTGGNVLQWLFGNVLRRNMTAEALEELTDRAALLAPDSTPILLPYLQGERAPLWDPRRTASLLELTAEHGEAHLFRAALEGIAFARRHCFDELGREGLHRVKIAGGSSKNGLWNSIRAAVLGKPLAVADEKELALAGTLHAVMEGHRSPLPRPAVHFTEVEPDAALSAAYETRYRKFRYYLERLS
ncbi:MAG TPA: FGGY-family carbohydrate kinase [Chitinophagaceae bacterium]|jgi:sugar (pentulose or hexulose) kinase|nr:FGGY-family carbohydrate kinase [Chitinophagaceae bacterium]